MVRTLRRDPARPTLALRGDYGSFETSDWAVWNVNPFIVSSGLPAIICLMAST